MASRQFEPHADAPRPQQAPHLQIVQAAPPHGGGGGGNHATTPQFHPGDDRHH